MIEKMPYEIKRKIRKLNKLQLESSKIQDEITLLFENYGLEFDLFIANADINALDQTEALANILNGQIKDIDLDDSIDQIEEIFLRHANETS